MATAQPTPPMPGAQAAPALPPAPPPVRLCAPLLLRYGALQFALSFAALPLYAFLPADYARRSGIGLGVLGLLLLLARLFDALLDPALGVLADRALARARPWRWVLAGSLPMLAGFTALMALPAWLDRALHPYGFVASLLLLLALTYAGYSALGIVHQAWGLRIGANPSEHARVFAWREGLGLAGVLSAALASGAGGPTGFALAFAGALALAVTLLHGVRAMPGGAPPASAMVPPAASCVREAWRAALVPLREPGMRRLLRIYLSGAVAASIPATLVVFFIRDRIQAPQWTPLFLIVYFAAGAALMPVWPRAARRLGSAGAWLVGTLLAIGSFACAALLQPGQRWGFVAVCAASGTALGADLALAPALLGSVIAAAGHRERLEGAYFGVWNLATKLALALAAGIALPLLQRLGYRPGQPQAGALPALVVAYCLLPCVLKALSGWWLWRDAIATPLARAPRGSAPAAPSEPEISP